MLDTAVCGKTLPEAIVLIDVGVKVNEVPPAGTDSTSSTTALLAESTTPGMRTLSPATNPPDDVTFSVREAAVNVCAVAGVSVEEELIRSVAY
jgi:hypothetical protein